MRYIRINNIAIKPNEILIDLIYINNIPFNRFYYKGKHPTRYFASKNGQVYSEISNVIMKPTTNKGGYYVLGLRFKNNGKPKYIQVHQIIATTYLGYKKGFVVDHKDGNKKNIDISNLEWVTSSINTKRAYKNGLHHKYFGDNNSNVIYSDEKIHQVCSYLEIGKPINEISKETGVSISTIHSIVSGKSRSNISKEYTIHPSLKMGPNKVIPNDVKHSIREMYKNKVPIKEIQKILKIDSYNKVIHVIYDERYKKSS